MLGPVLLGVVQAGPPTWNRYNNNNNNNNGTGTPTITTNPHVQTCFGQLFLGHRGRVGRSSKQHVGQQRVQCDHVRGTVHQAMLCDVCQDGGHDVLFFVQDDCFPSFVFRKHGTLVVKQRATVRRWFVILQNVQGTTAWENQDQRHGWGVVVVVVMFKTKG